MKLVVKLNSLKIHNTLKNDLKKVLGNNLSGYFTVKQQFLSGKNCNSLQSDFKFLSSPLTAAGPVPLLPFGAGWICIVYIRRVLPLFSDLLFSGIIVHVKDVRVREASLNPGGFHLGRLDLRRE